MSVKLIFLPQFSCACQVMYVTQPNIKSGLPKVYQSRAAKRNFNKSEE